jgi:hypothetical protein
MDKENSLMLTKLPQAFFQRYLFKNSPNIIFSSTDGKDFLIFIEKYKEKMTEFNDELISIQAYDSYQRLIDNKPKKELFTYQKDESESYLVNQCWKCHKIQKLSTCLNCKTAQYCGKECQQAG